MYLFAFTKIVLLLVCLCAPALCYQGNCSAHAANPVVVTSPSGSTVLTLFGDHGYLDSAYQGVVYPDSLRIDLALAGVYERNKTLYSQAYPYTCAIPRGFAAHPNDTERNGGPVAPIIRSWNMDEMDCYMYNYENVINDTKIRGIGGRYSHPATPNLYFVLSYEFAEKEIKVLASENTTFTKGELYYYHWLCVHFKVHRFPGAIFPSFSELLCPLLTQFYVFLRCVCT